MDRSMSTSHGKPIKPLAGLIRVLQYATSSVRACPIAKPRFNIYPLTQKARWRTTLRGRMSV